MKKLLLILKNGDESAFVCQIDDRAQDDAFVFYSYVSLIDIII